MTFLFDQGNAIADKRWERRREGMGEGKKRMKGGRRERVTMGKEGVRRNIRNVGKL